MAEPIEEDEEDVEEEVEESADSADDMDPSCQAIAQKHEMDVEERRVKKTKTVQDWDDLDAEDEDDPLMVSEYVVDIFNYLKKVEVMTR